MDNQPLIAFSANLPLMLLLLLLMTMSALVCQSSPNRAGCGNETSRASSFQIAVLLPDNSRPGLKVRYIFGIQYVRPAIELALEWVRANRMLDRPVTVKYADSRCHISAAIDRAFNFYMEHEVDVIFGPCCDYAAAPVARQVGWLPMRVEIAWMGGETRKNGN